MKKLILLILLILGCTTPQEQPQPIDPSISDIITLDEANELVGFNPPCYYITEMKYRLYPRYEIETSLASIEPRPYIGDELYGQDCDDIVFHYRYHLRELMPGCLAVMINTNGTHMLLRVYDIDRNYIEVNGTIMDNDTVMFYYM